MTRDLGARGGEAEKKAVIALATVAMLATCAGCNDQITGKDGKRYLVSSINCVLIEDEAE